MASQLWAASTCYEKKILARMAKSPRFLIRMTLRSLLLSRASLSEPRFSNPILSKANGR